MKWLRNIVFSAGLNIPSGGKAKFISTEELIKRESQIGSKVFGIVPPDRQREFFMLDERTWIWYEEWHDSMGRHSVTTRYEIHGTKIFKSQNQGPASQLHGAELKNFYNAVRTYYYQVAENVYHRPIQAVV